MLKQSVMSQITINNKKILKQAKELGFYNVDKLPGGANSPYRFVRTTFISENLPEAKSMDQAVNYYVCRC